MKKILFASILSVLNTIYNPLFASDVLKDKDNSEARPQIIVPSASNSTLSSSLGSASDLVSDEPLPPHRKRSPTITGAEDEEIKPTEQTLKTRTPQPWSRKTDYS